MDKLTSEVPPILALIVVIGIVVWRLPRVDVGHSPAYRFRRVLNWLPLGLTYAFLYMGRYNLNGLRDLKMISKGDFGDIDAVGSIVYGLAFLFNGPLTDKLGGRVAILLAAAGAAAANGAIGLVILSTGKPPDQTMLILLYAINMYFQSFGAVSIVKVNSSWFHLRERGTFGGIFGILISFGLYLAYDWAPKIASWLSLEWLFLAPAVMLLVFWVASFLLVRDTPAGAGFADFDVADASSGDTSPPDPALTIIRKMVTNKVILVIAMISFCSGFLRQAILKWFRTFADGVGVKDTYVYEHWGMISCIAGITGGMFAGLVSDHLFHSRRPPVATVLFAIALGGAAIIIPLVYEPAVLSIVIPFMLMAIIGVHGMLSGVASQDFGGRRNAGTATGFIDGFVYFGTALQAEVYGRVLPTGKDAADTGNWLVWPIAMIPLAILGLGLSLSVYNASVKPKSAH